MISNDRKLLEMAAKAAGIDVDGWIGGSNNIRVLHPKKPPRISVGYEWNPLTDDGDALRLSVKLQIDVKQYGDHAIGWFEGGFIGTGRIPYAGDPCKATRRAIVLAAAAIGRSGP